MNNTKTEKNSPDYGQKEQQLEMQGVFNMEFIYRTVLLNWSWFLLSLFICLMCAVIYLRYATRVYTVEAKVLIKSDDSPGGSRRASSLSSASNLLTGQISMTDGFENELEMLKSVTIAEDAVRNLKLYVDYKVKGKVKDRPIYKIQPIIVDLDKRHLDNLEGGIRVVCTKKDNGQYSVEGTLPKGSTFSQTGYLPMTIHTAAGFIYIYVNPRAEKIDNRTIIATISNPNDVAHAYTLGGGGMTSEALSKVTTIAVLKKNDVIPERAIDYITEFVDCYNRQANEDKNIVALRTEQFINNRLAKINNELGSTDGAIETYKRGKKIVDAGSNADLGLNSANDADKKLAEMNTQILLMQSIKEYMALPENKYQTLPSNVGLTDDAAKTLITAYNKLAIDRSRLLRSASESSPAVKTLTDQMNDLTASIYRAIEQAKRSMQIQKQALAQSFNKYNSLLVDAPEQERFLTQIGRQQTVRSSLYVMLLEKREENSISLAATANKGRLIDVPENMGQVAPKNMMVWGAALVVGFCLPLAVFMLMELTRFRIEGHDEVAKLTKCPIIADIALASDSAKSKAEIVVHEGKNDYMEEIFRGMRTNLQFMFRENQNVVMFTSSTSGEGKTFIASNLAVSFALLGKKVLLVGLDIRRPRLANLFSLKHVHEGITNVLVVEHPTEEQIQEQIVNSGVNANLDLLMAGPIPPNPAELVTRESLDETFAYLRKTYDYVIIDTAPVGLVSDTLQIGRVADVTCVCCRADYTEKSAFAMINGYAENDKLPDVCIVINGIDMSKKKYGYAYGYGKYGKYSKYGYKSYSSYGGSSYGYNSYGYNSYSYGSYGYGNTYRSYGSEDDSSDKKDDK